MRKLISIAVATLLASSLASAAGEVYRWKDSAGIWHYSDQPQAGAELVKGARRPVGAATASTRAPTNTARPAQTSVPPPPLPAVSNEVAQQVRQEASTAKADQCKTADEAYKKAVQARRIYKDDAKGNRTFLNEAEIEAARLEARSTRDLACGP
jgi:hypothetical protein